MLKIGDFSKLSQISIRMLRYYDELDILKPSYLDQTTGYRFYTVEQLEIAGLLQKLRILGFSSKAMKKILEDRSIGNIKYYFEERKQQLSKELQNLQNASKEIEQLTEGHFEQIEYNVVLKNIPKRTVISVRKILPSYMDEAQLWEILYNYIEKEKISVLEDCYAMAIYHDLEYKEENVDIEVQVSVSEKGEGTELIHFLEIESFPVASVLFNGSYDKMIDVTKTAIMWMERNGYHVLQPTFNIFHVSKAQDKDPRHWLTEACFKIKERKI